MELDRDRLRAILEADHSYYGSHAPESRIDDRLAPGASDFIASQFSPDTQIPHLTLLRAVSCAFRGVRVSTWGDA